MSVLNLKACLLSVTVTSAPSASISATTFSASAGAAKYWLQYQESD